MVGKTGEVGLEEIKEMFFELAKKRTWVRKRFEELMEEFASIFTDLIKREQYMEKGIIVPYKKVIVDGYPAPEEKIYRFVLSSEYDIELEIKSQLVDEPDTATYTLLFKIYNTIHGPELQKNVMTVREIREFCEAFPEILSQLEKELAKRISDAEETIEKLDKLLEALEVVQ